MSKHLRTIIAKAGTGAVLAGALVLGTQAAADAASTRTSAPRLVRHTTVTALVSTVAPGSSAFARRATPVPDGVRPRLSCGQYLTVELSTSWTFGGTKVMTLSSVDSTKWCSGKAYTESYARSCRNLNLVVAIFTCLGGATSGVIGQGSGEVNPWYDQPAQVQFLTASGYTTMSATAYGRNYFHANGTSSSWFTFNY